MSLALLLTPPAVQQRPLQGPPPSGDTTAAAEISGVLPDDTVGVVGAYQSRRFTQALVAA